MSNRTVIPKPPDDFPKYDATYTVDTFIAEVSLDPHRSILVYRRQHAGRTFIRWRVFHRHRRWGTWYPDKRRSFVIPVGSGDAMARAIAAAQLGVTFTAKPEWLAKVDEWREHRYRCLLELNAPARELAQERRGLTRGYGMDLGKRGVR